MVAKTYVCDLGAGATIFPGFVTLGGSGCAPAASSATGVNRAKMITAATPPCASSYRVQMSGITSLTHHRFALTPAKTSAQVVTGASFVVNLRCNAPSTWNFYLESYNAAGALQQTSTVVPLTGVSSGKFTISMVAAVVTVPASGFLLLRAGGAMTTARMYLGASARSLGPSGILTTNEVPAAVADNTADVVATAPSFGAVVSASYTAPSTKTASCNIQDSTSTAVPNGLDVLVIDETSNTIVATVQTTGGSGAVSHQDTMVTHPDYTFVLRQQVGFTTETITTPAVTPV